MTYTADRPVTVTGKPVHHAPTGLLAFDAEQDGHAFRVLVHDPAVSVPLAAVLTQGDTLNVEGAFEVRRWVDLAGEWHDRPTLVVTAAGPREHTTTITTADRYLVLAAICDCPGVAVTVIDGCYDRDNLEPDEDEVLYVGPDWRPLAVRAARELHEQTGVPVRAQCTVAYVSSKLPDRRAREDQLGDEILDVLYALPEEINNSRTRR